MNKQFLSALVVLGIGFSGLLLAKTTVWTCNQTSVELSGTMGVRSEFPGSNANFTMIIDGDTITTKQRFLVSNEYWNSKSVYTITKHLYEGWYVAIGSYDGDMLMINLKNGRFTKSSLTANAISGSIGQCYN